MKKRNRALEIFSVSALDLFASAMGTFILIAIVLFPYYLKQETVTGRLKQNSAEIERLKKRAAEAEAKAKTAEQQAAKAEADAASAKSALAKAKKRASGMMKIPKGGEGNRSVAFAIGCWKTDPFRHSAEQQPGISQYCFDKNGRGNLLFYRKAQGETCGAFATIRRQATDIFIVDSNSRCAKNGRDNGAWYADNLTCRPDASGVIFCEGQSRIGNRVDRWRVRLHRQ